MQYYDSWCLMESDLENEKKKKGRYQFVFSRYRQDYSSLCPINKKKKKSEYFDSYNSTL